MQKHGNFADNHILTSAALKKPDNVINALEE